MRTLLYRFKNSNILVILFLNPFSFKLKPTFSKKPTYADDWLYDPDLLEYEFRWLFFKISLFLETGTQEEGF